MPGVVQLREVSAGRVFIAVVLVGLGIAGAVALAGHRFTKVADVVWVPQTGGGFAASSYDTQAACLDAAQSPDGASCLERRDRVSYKPSWAVPLSILVGFVGLAAGGALLVAGREIPRF
jgi:hypothetical protein